MAHIVFIVANFAGHLNATFKLASDLRRRGHRITYLGTEATRAKIEAQQFAFETVDFIRDLPRDEKISAMLRDLPRRRSAAAQILAGLSDIPAATVALVQRLKPELLIFDPFYLIYAIPFYPYRIPALVLSVYPLLDYDPFVPPYTSPLTPDSSFQSWLLVQAAWLKRYLHYQPYRLRMWARKYLIGYSPYSLSERVAELHGFPLAEEWTTRPLSFDYRLASVPEIVLHSERFDLPRKNPLRPTVYYVGPCVDLHRYEPPFDWSRITVGKKLIFCSIGTVGPKDGFEEGFLRRVIAAVATLLQYTLVMSVGPGIDPQELGPIPQNVHVYSFVPQIEVLRHADLMISHGGANSIKECVLLGVPLLVYPRRADQPGNSARVIYHGLGLRGDLRKDTVAMIASKIKSVLDDARYATNVAAMRAHFESYQESQRHVQVIESFLQQPLDGSRIHDDRDPVVV